MKYLLIITLILFCLCGATIPYNIEIKCYCENPPCWIEAYGWDIHVKEHLQTNIFQINQRLISPKNPYSLFMQASRDGDSIHATIRVNKRYFEEGKRVVKNYESIYFLTE